MNKKYTQYCEVVNVEHNTQKARRIVDEMITSNDPDTGKACGSLAWELYSTGDYSNAIRYASKGSDLKDGNSSECLANIYYDSGEHEEAYRYLLKAKDEGSDVQDYMLDMFKSKVKSVTSGGKKQGCYIASCVYSSYDCPQVWTLRRYRDDILSNSCWGRAFIKIYYKVSPVLVRIFGKSFWFKAFWKKILDKKISSLNKKGIENTPYNDRMQ